MTTIKINNNEVSLPYCCKTKNGNEFFKVMEDITIFISDKGVSVQRTNLKWEILEDIVDSTEKEVGMKLMETQRYLQEIFFGNADTNIPQEEIVHEIGDTC